MGERPLAAVNYRRLGRSGLRVSELGLGTVTFGATTPIAEARTMFSRFADAGGTLIDTAVNYAGGASEEIVGDLIAADRDRFVVATKYTAPLRRDDPNSGGNHAKSLRLALETSLRRLGTDYIDLYWVHAWDQTLPFEELTRILDDAVRAGKVLHIGISNTPAWAIARANTIAEATGRTAFTAIQVEYNLTERTAERELLPMSQQLDLAVLAWGPLAGGALTGKYLAERAPAEVARLAPGDQRLGRRQQDIAAELAAVADELGATPAMVAYAWLRAQPSRPIPIAGARIAAHLDDPLASSSLELSPEMRTRLDAASAITLGYPHDFLGRIAPRYTVR